MTSFLVLKKTVELHDKIMQRMLPDFSFLTCAKDRDYLVTMMGRFREILERSMDGTVHYLCNYLDGELYTFHQQEEVSNAIMEALEIPECLSYPHQGEVLSDYGMPVVFLAHLAVELYDGFIVGQFVDALADLSVLDNGDDDVCEVIDSTLMYNWLAQVFPRVAVAEYGCTMFINLLRSTWVDLMIKNLSAMEFPQ